MANDLFNTPWDAMDLTDMGRRQHYLLGTWMRDRFIDGLKLISPTYKHEQVFFKTSNDNDTIESAMSQLLGFFTTFESSSHVNLTQN